MSRRRTWLSLILISLLAVTLTVFLCCCGVDTTTIAGSASQVYQDSYDEDYDDTDDIEDADDVDTEYDQYYDDDDEEYNDEDSIEDLEDSDAEDTDEELVWIPRTGKCYHNKPTCSNMKNPTQVPLSKALEQNKVPCQKCYGKR